MKFWVQSEFQGRLFALWQFPGFVYDLNRLVFYLSVWQKVKQLYYFGCPLTASHEDARTWDKHESIGFSEKFWELALCHSAWKWDKNSDIAPISSTLLKCPQILRLEKWSTKAKNGSVLLLLIMTGFRVTGRSKVLGFAWWTETQKYGLNSQVLICKEQVVWFCLRKKSLLCISDTQ